MTLDQLHTKGDKIFKEKFVPASLKWKDAIHCTCCLTEEDLAAIAILLHSQREEAFWSGAAAHREAMEIEEKHSNASDRGDFIAGGNDDGWNAARQESLKRSDEFFKGREGV